MGEDRWLDTAQVAKRLGCSTQHVRDLIAAGKLAARDISAGTKFPRWRIPEAALLSYMTPQEAGTLARMKTRAGVP